MKLVKIFNKINNIYHKISFDKHRKIRSELISLNKDLDKSYYDYGEGFFYQSLPVINLKGLRDTSKRIEKLNLEKFIEGKSFLDIGTNIGSIPLSIKNNFKYCLGIDHNPDVINIAIKVKEYLKNDNIDFVCANFLTFEFQQKFELILSLANHSTFDKGINDTKKYFEKISELLLKDGILILESHSPLYESSDSHLQLVKNLKKDYQIIDHGKYDFGNYYDQKRIFHIMKKIK